VDPGYRTLGAYYFNNDLRNITLNTSASLLQGKLNVSANAGTQRNNLDNQEINQMTRFIGSVSAAYTPGPRLNLNASYSNFNTYTVIRSAFTDLNQVTPVSTLDTLNYTQLSQSANVTATYALSKNPNVMKMLVLNVAYQQATDAQAGKVLNTGSRFINSNMAYTQQVSSIGAGFTVALNTNVSLAGDLESLMIGPTISVNKSIFKKKIQTSLSVSYNEQTINGEKSNSFANVRLMSAYRVSKHHSFSLSGVVLNKSSREKTSPDFTEYTATLGYNYNF
jgi:hypothetical protein